MSNESDNAAPVRVKFPVLIAVLSFLVPGLGQICCAQDNKGVFLLGITLLGHWLTGGVSTVILCLVMGLDAYTVARRIKSGSTIRKWAFFPGLAPFDRLQPRVIPLILVCLIFAIAAVRMVIYAQGYDPGN